VKNSRCKVVVEPFPYLTVYMRSGKRIVLNTYYIRQFYPSVCPSRASKKHYCNQTNEDRIMRYLLWGSKNYL